MPPRSYRDLKIKQPSSMKAATRGSNESRRSGEISRSKNISSDEWPVEVKPIDRTKLNAARGKNVNVQTNHCTVRGRNVSLIDCLEMDDEIVLTFTCPSNFQGNIPLKRNENILTICTLSKILIVLPENAGKLKTADYNNGICVMRFGK